MTTDVEVFFAEGCGRCSLGGTPACKVHTWARELALLRKIILSTGLIENCKWGVPSYTYSGKVVLNLSAYKEAATIGFFKGGILSNADGLLEKAGENANAGRVLKFKNVERIVEVEKNIKSIIFEAIEVEKAGLKVPTVKVEDLDFPEELKAQLNADEAFKNAFEALTPGKKKGYIFHFNKAKTAKTREGLVEKFKPQILMGKGVFDR